MDKSPTNRRATPEPSSAPQGDPNAGRKGQKPPHFNNVMLILTDGCNLRCTYCYEKSRTYRSTQRMSWPTARRAIDQFLQQLPEHAERSIITFFGGEPTLAFDLIKKGVAHSFPHSSIGQSRGKGYSYVINTNGTVLTEEMYQFYGRLGKRLNLRVSADGFKEGHDATRKLSNGRGSWALLEKNFAYYRKLKENFGVDIHIISTINKASYRDIYRNLTRLHEFTGMQIGCLFVHEDPWAPADFDELSEQILQLKDYSLRHRIAMPLCRTQWPKTPTSEPERGGPICGAGVSAYTVTPQGDLFACHRCRYNELGDEFWLGNLETGLQPQRVARMRELNNIRKMPEKCEHCLPVVREKCHPCLASNKQAYGACHRVSEAYCQFMQSLHARVVAREGRDKAGPPVAAPGSILAPAPRQ